MNQAAAVVAGHERGQPRPHFARRAAAVGRPRQLDLHAPLVVGVLDVDHQRRVDAVPAARPSPAARGPAAAIPRRERRRARSGPPQPWTFDHEFGPQPLGRVEAVADLDHVVLAREHRAEAAQRDPFADVHARVGIGHAAPAQEAPRHRAQVRLGQGAAGAAVERHGCARPYPCARRAPAAAGRVR